MKKKTDYKNLSQTELIKLLESKDLELKQIEQDLEHNSKLHSLGEVTVGVSHEISNHLSVLQSSFSRLKIEIKEKNNQKLLSIAEKSIVRLTELGNSLSHLAYGGVSKESKTTVFAAEKVLEDTYKLVRKTFERSEIEVDLKLQEDLWVKGVEANFQHVFLNLLINAKDALGKSKNKKIKVSAQKDLENVLLIVSDNGEGIAVENQQKVFEGFFTTKAQGKGTGLGLSLSKKWVEQMQGTIKLESELGDGASFILQFPLAQEQKNFKNGEYFNQALLVHKDQSISQVLAAGINRMGMSVEIVHTTQEAFEKLDQESFDLVLAGYELDNMNGLQLLNSLHAKGFHPWKSLLLDRKLVDLDPKLQEGVEQNCDFWLELPYSEEKIQKMVAKVKEQKLKSA